MSDAAPSGPGITRRKVVGGAALFGLGVGVDRLLPGRSESGNGTGDRSLDAVPFFGQNQAGIATPAQEFVNFAAFDVNSEAVEDLRSLLVSWTDAAAALTAGRAYYSGPESSGAPVDTGEAIGLGPSNLTLTFGFGPTLLGAGTRDRFGLRSVCPDPLRPLPSFRGDVVDRGRSDGDLCIQACADDAQVAFHAIHVLTRLASDAATLRWGQAGFGRTSSTSRTQPTPRNLMGFKDGTENIRAEDRKDMDRFVWVDSDDGPAWMSGGSYLVARRIQILLDVWDATSLEGQERAVGRAKLSGAPLGKTGEYDQADFDAQQNGVPLIPLDAHVRLASPSYNHDQRILRRGYSYIEPPEPNSGQIDAGLFFIAFQRDPFRQFVPIQRRLAKSDALSRHTLHTASALFACPPGVGRGSFIGEALFG